MARPNEGPMLGIGQRGGAKPASQSTSAWKSSSDAW
jgi:hypothetical protein